MNKELSYPLQVGKSKIAGKGAFALKSIPAKKKAGEYGWRNNFLQRSSKKSQETTG